MPRKFLIKHISQQIKALKKKIDFSQFKGLSRESYEEYVISAIARRLQPQYEVSLDVLAKRIKKEIEKTIIRLP